jgi:hypothetical protein
MSNAFNLSQLANFVDSSGKLNVATGSTGTLPTTQGGTGLTTVGTNGQVLQSNGTSLTWATPSSGGVTSLNGQTGAITNTAVDAIGSYGMFYNAGNANTAYGATVAGSSLRYNTNDTGAVSIPTYVGAGGMAPAIFQQAYGTSNNATFPAGGSSVSGTWRRMPHGTSGAIYVQQTGDKGAIERRWAPGFFVRIS